MEYFIRGKYVRLKSLHNKYLVAGKDGKSIKQSRNGKVIRAYWTIELVNERPNLIRLRSCHGKLLTASDDPFLLGWTGNKVMQTPGSDNEPSVLWEPVSSDHSFYIRLRTPQYNRFLRANGGAPPWRQAVTVDFPGSAVTQDWNLWFIDAPLDYHFDNINHSIDQCSLPRSSESEDLCSSWQDDGHSTPGTPASSASSSLTYKSGTLDLQNAKTIRLLTHRKKYLSAHEDGESVIQSKGGNSKETYWTLEHVNSTQGDSLVRLKSSYQKYLIATEDNFLLGATGKKVKQAVPERLDYAIEWELIRDGKKVKLKTWDGNFLRANGSVPPWRNSVTHDHSSISHTKDKILWTIEVIDVYDD